MGLAHLAAHQHEARADRAQGCPTSCRKRGNAVCYVRGRAREYGLQHRTSLLAAPFETDRKDESEIGIGNGGWRWRQWCGACEQEKRLGIEYRRAGTLDDLTVQHVTLPIDTEPEIGDARRALGLRRIALETRYASDDGLLPAGNRWSQLR